MHSMLQPRSAFWCLALVHGVDLERQERVDSGCLTGRSAGTKSKICTARLPNRSLHVRLGAPVSRAWAIRHPPQFLGSKAGATFRLAMISIGSGLKPPRRNAVATIVF